MNLNLAIAIIWPARASSARCSYPMCQSWKLARATRFYGTIFAIKDRARATIQKLLPDPQAALLIGILLGDDSGLAPELEEQFRVTGLTHIIAISGFNIAILVGLLVVVSKPFLGRRRAAWFVLAGLSCVCCAGWGWCVCRTRSHYGQPFYHRLLHDGPADLCPGFALRRCQSP